LYFRKALPNKALHPAAGLIVTAAGERQALGIARSVGAAQIMRRLLRFLVHPLSAAWPWI
jgi:hypothetical protein